jgi:hypothetical protein
LYQIASTKNEDERQRLRTIIDYEGDRQLRTPRSVVRALDSIRFYWPPLLEAKADLADLVWLQLIKNGNPELYRWIESYSATQAGLSVGTVQVEETERVRTLADFHNCTEPSHFEDRVYQHYFAEQLPGIAVDYTNDKTGFNIYQAVANTDRDAAIRDGRLASPDHYRLYFALAGPLHALKSADFVAMRAALESGVVEAQAELVRLHQEQISDSLGKADMMLERIKGGAFELLSAKQRVNLLIAFSHTLDTTYNVKPSVVFGTLGLWNRAERLIPVLLSRLEQDERAAVLKTMFTEGKAMGWLTSVLRRETFAHGRYGSRARPMEDWLVTGEEFAAISADMLVRFQALTPDQLIESMDPLDLLFAWLQLGDDNGPRRLVQASIETEEGFIKVLEGLKSGSSRRSDGVLKRESLSPFLDYDAAIDRIKSLKDSGSLSEQAAKLLDAFNDGASR